MSPIFHLGLGFLVLLFFLWHCAVATSNGSTSGVTMKVVDNGGGNDTAGLSSTTAGQNGDQGAPVDDKTKYPCGYPCDENEWCGTGRWKRCRPCSDLDKFCNDILNIQQDYSSCVQHCYRVQEKETQKFKENYDNTELALRNCSRRVDQLEREVKTRDDAYKKKAVDVNSLNASLKESQETVERLEGERADLKSEVAKWKISVAVVAVIMVVILSGLIWLALENRELKKASQRGGRDAAKAGESGQSLLSGASVGVQEEKPPVQVNRNSTHFEREDQYCFPGGGGKAHAVPGDSSLNPS